MAKTPLDEKTKKNLNFLIRLNEKIVETLRKELDVTTARKNIENKQLEKTRLKAIKHIELMLELVDVEDADGNPISIKNVEKFDAQEIIEMLETINETIEQL